MTGKEIEEAFVDRGYRDHGETHTTVYISGQKRGIKTQRLKQYLKRRPGFCNRSSAALKGAKFLILTTKSKNSLVLVAAPEVLRLVKKLR